MSSFNAVSPTVASRYPALRPPLYLLSFVYTCLQSLFSLVPSPALIWVALLTSGLAVGLVQFAMSRSLTALTDLKLEVLTALPSEQRAATIGIYLLYTGSLAAVASCLVTFVSPINTGSGLPETKALLNGTDIPTFLRCSTIVTKIVSITLVVAAGFPVGKEGPMVHVGAAVCSGILNDRLFNRRRDDIVSAVDNTASGFHRKSTFCTIGGAAGIAAAFNAPIGGIL